MRVAIVYFGSGNFVSHTDLHTMSQKTSHLWFVITYDTHEQILIFFGRNISDKVGDQKVL